MGVVNNDIVTWCVPAYTRDMAKVLDQVQLRKLAAAIKNIKPFDDAEESHKIDALSWIASGENVYRIKKPDIPPKHLVSYFVLVDPNHRSILLVDHIKAQLWLPPGGHVKFNEDPKDAVRREALEEFNIPATFLNDATQPFFITSTVTVGLTPGHTDVSLWYLLRGSVHDFLQYDKSEFVDTEWYTFEEVLESDPVIFDPHLHRFTEKLRRYLKVLK